MTDSRRRTAVLLPQPAAASHAAADAHRDRALFVNFFTRELTTRYLGSASGLAWALMHPLALLAVYHFVFTTVFRAGSFDGQELPAVRRRRAVAVARRAGSARSAATVSLAGYASLIRKVAFPHEIVVYASVARDAHAAVRGLPRRADGVLKAFGEPVHFEGLLIAAAAVDRAGGRSDRRRARCLSALQVFVRDVEHVLDAAAHDH